VPAKLGDVRAGTGLDRFAPAPSDSGMTAIWRFTR
jgi:hypothetical protein